MIQDCFITVPPGLEDLLAEELRQLGADQVRPGRAGVWVKGELTQIYRFCLWSRLANRVLLTLSEFPSFDAEDLYAGVRAIPWDQHLAPEASLAVDFTGTNERITNTHYGALRVKDAVVDWFRERYHLRPWVDTQHPDLRLHLHLHLDRARLSLDLSGDSLHRRGYRTQGGEAPLKENLAAALLRRAGWPGIAAAMGPLVDPMCGSGTLPIEALLMATDWAPGLLRESFGFLRWRGHEPQLWQALLEEAQARKAEGLTRTPPIFGYDADAGAVRRARENAARAGVSHLIRLEHRDLGDLTAPPGQGLLIVNPPYGERLGELEALEPLYARLGERLKASFQGWQAAVFTGNPELGKQMGLRAKRWHAFLNGAIECRLLRFEVESESFVSPGPRPPPPLIIPDLDSHPFANRLRKNLRHLRRWAKREGVSCYRVYDADIPEYAAALDVYEDWLHLQEYAPPADIDPAKAEFRWRELVAIVPEVMEIPGERLFLKRRQRQKGAAQYRKQADLGQFHQVHEGEAVFWVNFTDYLDTGLFLDHRLTRGLLHGWAAGKHFLNLFCYTGTASVQAALGGAASTTSVDLSAVYLDWAERNLALNRLPSRRHRLIQADCREWIQAERSTYDLIFLDPPTFSNSKRMEGTFDVQRDHVPLLQDCLARLAPGGSLIFSTNARRFQLDSAALAGIGIQDLSAATLPEDFKRHPRIHRCWKFRLGG